MPTPKKTPPKKTKQNDESQETETEETETEESESADDSAEENRRINAIVTSRVKREMKGVLSTLNELKESLAKMTSAKKPDDETESEDTETEETETRQTKKREQDPAVVRKLTKLEKELADEKAARKQAEQDRAAELERGKKAEMRGAFQSVLAELGLTSPRLMRAALDQLEQDGIMTRDEDGKVKFKGQDKYGIETMFDPKAGLKAWIANDGKEFVPAIDAGGSGTGGTQRGTGNGTQTLSAKDIKGMTPQQLASINLERACSGLPPLGEDK